MKIRSILPLVYSIVLTGCAAGGAQFNSRTFEKSVEPSKNVLIFFNAKSPHFAGALYTSFVGSTQRRIESCGVKVTVLEYDPLEIDMRAKLSQTIEKSNAETVLFFLRNGGNLVTGSGGVMGNLYFDVQASDTKRSKIIWKAVIDYRTLTQNMYIDDKLSAEVFSSQFVSKLETDHLIGGCPTEATTVPK